MAYKTLVICSILLCFSSQSYAEVSSGGGAGCETSINCTVVTGTASSNTPRGGVENQMNGAVTSTTNYGTDGTVGQQGTGAYTQAKKGKTQAIVMGVAAAALGTSYMIRCASSNRTACFLAAAAFTAAGYAASKAMQSQKLMNDLGTSGSTTGTVDTSTVQEAALQRELTKLKADLVRQGYTVDDTGNITTPSGTSVNGDLSPVSLAAAGVSGQESSAIQQGLEDMRKQLAEKAGAEAGIGAGIGAGDLVAQPSGSTGYGRVSISSLDGNQKETTSATEAERTGIDRDPAAWGGFFKQFGDGVIGVSHSDIFLMVEKRVDRERTGMGH
jgi:hypothetical protein